MADDHVSTTDRPDGSRDWHRDWGDLVGGGLTLLGGGFVLAYTLGHYELGRLRHMGPGMLPAALGVILMVLGLFIVIPALRRRTVPHDLNLRPVIAVAAAIGAFALIMPRFGLLPAVAASVCLSAYAERSPSPIHVAVLILVLASVSTLVFVLGLGLPLPLLAWDL